MIDVMHSVGIDIGTTTTQLIFSKIHIEQTSSGYGMPKVDIVKKEVCYRSPIMFTPLLDGKTIDVRRLLEFIRDEYRAAGFHPKDMDSGAVIITGETARKENAKEVLKALSDFGGDFVVAAAGPQLESVLAGKGAGADSLSRQTGLCVANVDIGGGTTNIAVFRNGECIETTCLDLGGRLIQLDKNREVITYVYEKMQKVAMEAGVQIGRGSKAEKGVIRKICQVMGKLIFQELNFLPRSNLLKGMYTNGGNALSKEGIPDLVTFSGGVADEIFSGEIGDVYPYGDVGCILGQEIRSLLSALKVNTEHPGETIRATVVGAGIHSMTLSGSTISVETSQLPLKNVPVLMVPDEREEELPKEIYKLYHRYLDEIQGPIALTFGDHVGTDFQELQKLARDIAKGAQRVIESQEPLIVVFRQDVAKTVGQALRILLPKGTEFLCVDSVKVQAGDYLDFGCPLSGQRAIPLVIKTLVFHSP